MTPVRAPFPTALCSKTSDRAWHGSPAPALLLRPYNFRIRKYDGGPVHFVLTFAHKCRLRQAAHPRTGVASLSQSVGTMASFRFQYR
jgi:hypothetical protein